MLIGLIKRWRLNRALRRLATTGGLAALVAVVEQSDFEHYQPKHGMKVRIRTYFQNVTQTLDALERATFTVEHGYYIDKDIPPDQTEQSLDEYLTDAQGGVVKPARLQQALLEQLLLYQQRLNGSDADRRQYYERKHLRLINELAGAVSAIQTCCK